MAQSGKPLLIGSIAMVVISLITCVLCGVEAHAAGDHFECEELREEECAFAVSSSGARCVLETNLMADGSIQLECQTSKAVTHAFRSYVESERCVEACGLSRKSVGLSSDFLGERELQRSICAPRCQRLCPNIIELFTTLAAGEGVGLQALCESEGSIRSRKLIQAWGAGLSVANPPSLPPSPLPQ